MKKNNFFVKWAVVFLAIGTISAITYALPKKKAPAQDRRITITLPEQDWNIVMQALSEMPLKTSGGVYSAIMTQAQAQLAPPPAKQTPSKDTTKKKS